MFVPSIIGQIHCAPDAIQQIRMQQQNNPTKTTNIFVEFAANQWNLCNFELVDKQRSPPQQPEIVNAEQPILMGGFGQNAIRCRVSKIPSTKRWFFICLYLN